MRSSLEIGSELSEPDDLYTICPLLQLFLQLQPELKCSSCLNKGELTKGLGRHQEILCVLENPAKV